MANFIKTSNYYFTLDTVDSYFAEYRTDKNWPSKETGLVEEEDVEKKVYQVSDNQIREESLNMHLVDFEEINEGATCLTQLSTDFRTNNDLRMTATIEQKISEKFKFKKYKSYEAKNLFSLLSVRFKGGVRCMCRVLSKFDRSDFVTEEETYFSLNSHSDGDYVLDVEVVDGKGGVFVVVYDIMSYNGRDVTEFCLRDRDALRKKVRLNLQCSLIMIDNVTRSEYYDQELLYKKVGLQVDRISCIVNKKKYYDSVEIWYDNITLMFTTRVNLEKGTVSWMVVNESMTEVVVARIEPVGDRFIPNGGSCYASYNWKTRMMVPQDSPAWARSHTASKSDYDFMMYYGERKFALREKLRLRPRHDLDQVLEFADFRKYVYKD